MIRLVFLLRRKPELSLDAFHARWRDEHGPLVASVQQHLGIVRYTQSHRLDDPLNERMAAARGGMEEPFDGVAELWFASEAAFLAASRTEAGKRAGALLLEDEAQFIDLPRSPLWLAHDLPQINPAGDPIVARPHSTIAKLHFPLRPLPSLTFEQAQAYWRIEHGPLIRRLAPASGILRYQQVHRFDTPVEAALRAARGVEVETYMGHAETWMDRARGTGAPETRAAARAAVADERTFVDLARSSMWIGKEHVVVDRW